MRVLFIINPAAGANRAAARWAAFEAEFNKTNIASNRVFTSGPGDATQIARKALTDYEVLVAVGGDGTIAEVATGILTTPGSQTVLGVLPFGTGNDVAEVLGIRTDSDALNSILEGQTRLIDVMQVHCQTNQGATDRYALLFAGVGIISDALRKTTPSLKRLFGHRMAYPAGLVRALCKYRSPRMSIACDEQEHQEHYLFVGASNTSVAGGGMKIAPGAQIDDGMLNVNLIAAVSPWRALQLLRRVGRGSHLSHPQVRYLTARRLEINAPTGMEVAADGDLIGYTPVDILVQPGALLVLAASQLRPS